MSINNYFVLTLDTTAPTIAIYAPNYTARNVETSISVVCDEELSLYQNIYFVDSTGVRHNLILEHQGNKFVGTYSFGDIPMGIGTIYAQVQDTVYNKSILMKKNINIYASITDGMLQIDHGVIETPIDMGISSEIISLSVEPKG